MLVVLKFRAHNHKVTIDNIVSIKSTPLTELFVETIVVNNGITFVLTLSKV